MVSPHVRVGEAAAAGLLETVGLTDGGIEIDGERSFVVTGPRLPGPGQGFPAYDVELQGMSEAKRAQEGAKRGGSPQLLAEHGGGAARAEQSGVIDRAPPRQGRSR